MKVLCDTNIFIKLFRGDQGVISRLGEIGNENVLMPVITAMELFSGVQNKKDLQRIEREIRAYNIFQLDEKSSKTSLVRVAGELSIKSWIADSRRLNRVDGDWTQH